GGGQVDLRVLPCQKILPVNLSKRIIKNAKIICSYSGLSNNEISSHVNSIKNTLQRKEFSTESHIAEETALNQGASVLIFSHDSGSITGTDELLDTKSTSEFGKSSTSAFLGFDLGVDANLSDMLITPLSLTKEMSIFTVKEISKHLETNLYITSKITGCKYGIGKIDGGFEVRIQGSETSI
ncbi:MAG: RNA 3'-terminal phosphate cyclase, partial [Candidatus Nitrosotenuis sp.]